jgi:hypothetical protein
MARYSSLMIKKKKKDPDKGRWKKNSKDSREEEYLIFELRELLKVGLKKVYCNSKNGEGRIAFGA